MSASPLIDPHASDFVAAPSAAIPEAGGTGKNARRNAEIIAKRKAGMWPRQIAKEMGLSHNVVIGVCNRAGLSGEAGKSECARGEQVGLAKLRDDDVRFIRAEHAPHDPQFGTKGLARRYGVDPGTIRNVVHGRGWTHVEQAT